MQDLFANVNVMQDLFVKKKNDIKLQKSHTF